MILKDLEKSVRQYLDKGPHMQTHNIKIPTLLHQQYYIHNRTFLCNQRSACRSTSKHQNLFYLIQTYEPCSIMLRYLDDIAIYTTISTPKFIIRRLQNHHNELQLQPILLQQYCQYCYSNIGIYNQVEIEELQQTEAYKFHNAKKNKHAQV